MEKYINFLKSLSISQLYQLQKIKIEEEEFIRKKKSEINKEWKRKVDELVKLNLEMDRRSEDE